MDAIQSYKILIYIICLKKFNVYTLNVQINIFMISLFINAVEFERLIKEKFKEHYNIYWLIII